MSTDKGWGQPVTIDMALGRLVGNEAKKEYEAYVIGGWIWSDAYFGAVETTAENGGLDAWLSLEPTEVEPLRIVARMGDSKQIPVEFGSVVELICSEMEVHACGEGNGPSVEDLPRFKAMRSALFVLVDELDAYIAKGERQG